MNKEVPYKIVRKIDIKKVAKVFLTLLKLT